MILINSSPKDALKIFQSFLPIYVPVGIGYLLAAVEQEGIEAEFIDEQVQDNIFSAIEEYTKKMERPYIFGFSVLTASLKRAIYVSRQLKKRYPDSVIIFGGPHPTALPEDILSYKHIDLVVKGEGEQVLPKLFRRIKAGKDIFDIPGVCYKRNGRIINNEKAPVLTDIDSLPSFPYDRFTSQRYDLGFIVSSRGCPHKCIFCSNRITTGKRYRFRSPEGIVDDLEILYNKYQKKNILFLDDNLLVSKKRIYALIGKIKKKGLEKKMTFSFQARGDNVDYQLLKDLYNAGFKSVFFGMETASEKIMQTVKKGETVEQCIAAARMAKQIGFHVSATFIYALPGDTHKNRMDCVALGKNLKLDMVRFNNATPYPGTELYELAKKEGNLIIQGKYENFNSVSTFIENPFNKIPFSYVPDNNSEKAIRRDILFSYFAFYLDFKKFKKILSSPDEGVGWFSAGDNFRKRIKMIPALLMLGGMMCFKFIDFFMSVIIAKEGRILIKDFFQLAFGKWEK
jgi:anaerobic magnesium-protoporphyrin IX monomethyl ester cyclase